MKRKGFTLVELMVVLVIIAIISMIGFGGIALVQQNVKKSLWQCKIDMIESGAQLYGEDNKNRLNGTCTVNGVTKDACTTISVQYLLDNNYVTTDEKDEAGNEVIINESLPEDNANYYANNLEVFVYLENNTVHAKLNYEES